MDTTIASLEEERVAVAAKLEAQTITVEQVDAFKALVEEYRRKLPEADKHFEKRRTLIDALDIMVTLTIEDDWKVGYLHGVMGKEPDRFLIVSMSSGTQSCGG